MSGAVLRRVLGWVAGVAGAVLAVLAAAGVLPAFAQAGGFGDVAVGSYYSAPVQELAALGVLTGCEGSAGFDDSRFCPGEPMDRKTMAVWVVRVLDGEDPPPGRSRFPDVNTLSAFWWPFVERMAELGVTTGCGDGANFCPDDPVTRAQMAVFLWRAFDLPDGPDPGFSDVPGGAWYYDAVAALAASGITQGCGSGTTFCPGDDTTRAQTATFLNRARQRTEAAADDTSATLPAFAQAGGFGDVAVGSYYSAPVQELAGLGVLTGCEGSAGFDDSRFCPGEPMDRKTMAVWVVRVLDGEDPPPGRSRFPDVNTLSAFWWPFVERMAELGVTTGCGDGANFCPDDPVTRAQMAVFLWRAFDLPDGPDPGFSDVPGGAWYYDAVAALAASGITQGCGSGTTFCPGDDTTRAQMATFLNRARQRTEAAADDTSATPQASTSSGGGGGGQRTDTTTTDTTTTDTTTTDTTTTDTTTTDTTTTDTTTTDTTTTDTTTTDTTTTDTTTTVTTTTVTTTTVTPVAVRFGAASHTATEGGAAATVQVVLSADPQRTVDVPLTVTRSGGATPGDYTVSATGVTFHAGQTTASFTVTAIDDSADDDDESVTIRFGTLPPGVTAASPNTARVALADNDDPLGRVTMTLPAGCVLRDLVTGDEMPYSSYLSGCASLHVPGRNAHYYRLVVREQGTVTLGVVGTTASHLLIRSASGEVIERYVEPGEIEYYRLSLTRTLDAGTYVIEVAAQWHHFQDHGRGHTLSYTGSSIVRPAAYRLIGLSITDVNLASFAPDTTKYSRNVAADVQTVTVTPTATLEDADVTIMPPDADTSTDGHQVDIAAIGTTEITIAVNIPMVVNAGILYRVALKQLAGTTAPLSDVASLASLSFEGIVIGDFSSDKTDYTFLLGFYQQLNGTTATMSVTVANGSTWTANRTDENEDVTGHQLSIDRDDVVVVTVTSQDNANTRVYRVTPQADNDDPLGRVTMTLPAGCVLRDLVAGDEMPYSSYLSGCASLHVPGRNAHYYRLVVREQGTVTLGVVGTTASHLLIRSASGEVIERYVEPGEIEYYRLSLTRTLDAGTYVIEVAAQWHHFRDHGRGHTLSYTGSSIVRPEA